MNNNIDLYKILKGHSGETFYSPLIGDDVILIKTDNKDPFARGDITVKSIHSLDKYNFNKDGSYYRGGECMLFPSKNQRDWDIWIEENKPKIPKIWSELIKTIQPILYCEISHKSDGHYISVSEDCGDTPIESSTLALLKIFQLIDVGYGHY